jgi:hypothetical protein
MPSVTSLWAACFAILSNVACVWSHPSIPTCFGQLEWLPKELYWLGIHFTPRVINEEHRHGLSDINDNPSVPRPVSKAADEQRRLTEHGEFLNVQTGDT